MESKLKIINKNKKILVTGSAGFIGSALTYDLVKSGYNVYGIDNENNYYDPKIKKARLKRFIQYSNYKHFKVDLTQKKKIEKIFKKFKPHIVINLAAQAGVRYSIENPSSYVSSNVEGFLNILENSKNYNVKHLIYASTSSVYGLNVKMPLEENDDTSHPLSIYAATKKSNEIMAHAYSHLFDLPTTGVRFFTVYGPWGRPDMALFKFTRDILNKKPITVFNNGKHVRDFTYIDDVVSCLKKLINKRPKKNKRWTTSKSDLSSSSAPWQIYNIGNGKPINLLKYINIIESELKIKAKIKFLPMQAGDIFKTHAQIRKINTKINFTPKTNVNKGIKKFIEWYKDYYKIKFT